MIFLEGITSNAHTNTLDRGGMPDMENLTMDSLGSGSSFKTINLI